MSTQIELEPRMELGEVAPEQYRAMLRFDGVVDSASLDSGLLDLVRTRASQINGCAYCIDMHTKDARAGGESEQRLYGLAAWRETPYYSDRERAALELTESITLLAERNVSDEVWEAAAREFERAELAQLVFAIAAINTWNRLAVPTRMVPGDYQP
jgi:AhpD family alkylhydroperoxidase